MNSRLRGDAWRAVLSNMNQDITKRLQLITDAIAKIGGVSCAEIIRRNRRQDIAILRHVCFYVARNEYAITLERIATFYSLTHSSVIHGVRAIQDEISVCPRRLAFVEAAKAAVREQIGNV